jgi:hypothetical protein
MTECESDSEKHNEQEPVERLVSFGRAGVGISHVTE